jgi:hypothetical protein
MKANVGDPFFMHLRRAVMAVFAGGIFTASAVQANPSDNIVVVPPTDLPELARQPGEAMLLRDTIDGRAILYVEQEQGAQLAIFDVTDPAGIKSEGAVQLSTSGPFDFVSAIGSKQELIEYRQGHEDAVFDFHKTKLPNLKSVEGLTLHGSSSPILSTVFDVKQVRETLSKADTGTTFLLAKEGLYVIRRPAVESEMRRRDEEWSLEHTGD